MSKNKSVKIILCIFLLLVLIQGVQADTIRIMNNGFTPNELTILPGTGITWINDDSVVHRLEGTTDTGTNLFRSGLLSPGQTWSYTFGDNFGSVNVIDVFHPSMQGVITLKKGSNFAGSFGDAATSTQTTVLTTQTTIPSSVMKVHISYLGGYKGTYGMASNLQSVRSSGDNTYQIFNAAGPIQANVQKTDGSNRHELVVEIYKDGILLTRGSTNAGYGQVTLGVDATTGIVQTPITSPNVITDTPTVTQTTVLTTQTPIPSSVVKVHISYLGGFEGTYGLASNLRSIQSSGDQVYQITNAVGPIQVDIQKTDGSSQNDLLVEIYKDNLLLTQGSTKHPFGHVIITVDANTGVANVYLPTPTVTSTQTTLSTTTVITTIITPQATQGTTIPTTVTTIGSPTSLTTVPTTAMTTTNTPPLTPTPDYDTKIAALEKQIAEQNQKIDAQGTILDKITTFLRNVFGWK
ncbi:hypothetical protein [uncultured Methanoregula sp.]|uniref:cupredoxin domain-containing protein n=1 Tax=uncultured Methanoregula sp. TaxID=1005933 RepID=UPI002AAC3285|nr:hypothetical protein [uncultured Methanoregula sp.]